MELKRFLSCADPVAMLGVGSQVRQFFFWPGGRQANANDIQIKMESVLAVVSHVVDVRPSRSQIVDTRDRDAIIAALHDAFGSAATAARRAQEWLPAPQPISLDKRGLKSLRTGRDDYLCTLKADGSRFVLLMLMIEEDPIAVMVSRKLEMYEVPLVAQPHPLWTGPADRRPSS